MADRSLFPKKRIIMESISYKRREKQSSFHFITVGLVYLLNITWCGLASGSINGVCSDCHTMHNSQANAPMNFDGSTTPNENLTRGDCLGCHAQGGSSPTVVQGTSSIPQVLHTGATDLAGGNFGYITGAKGSGAADNKGHNIGTLTGVEGTLSSLPGGIVEAGHSSGANVPVGDFTCAGTNGCHGGRYPDGTGPEGITGAHHKNQDGQLNVADETANSYRFLLGVQGFESGDWQENATAGDHNEYYGLTAPIQLGCGGGGAVSCHGTGGVQPPDGTMSQFCATCHGNFHTLETSSSDGVGGVAASPFVRHPTDLALPAVGEYAAYTTYDLQAPVARTTVPAAASGSVAPGTDAVMCLSCHVAHASDYASMLRWDYDTMLAGGGGASNGCFTCHTTKD